ncbi:hypothetical protein HS7_11140 [Sulfolobales archaeon HS-7]|nr:hypothetical protein HS7_11140 [Sulfolobales archaeon HS-7]
MQWLIGSPILPWKDMVEIFEDYPAVAVYTVNNEIEMIKTSQFMDMNNPYRVLLHPFSLKKMTLSFVKFNDLIVIPTFSERVLKTLVENKGWTALSYYEGYVFLGGYLFYPCRACYDKQEKHLSVKALSVDDEITMHLEIYNS